MKESKWKTHEIFFLMQKLDESTQFVDFERGVLSAKYASAQAQAEDPQREYDRPVPSSSLNDNATLQPIGRLQDLQRYKSFPGIRRYGFRLYRNVVGKNEMAYKRPLLWPEIPFLKTRISSDVFTCSPYEQHPRSGYHVGPATLCNENTRKCTE